MGGFLKSLWKAITDLLAILSKSVPASPAPEPPPVEPEPPPVVEPAKPQEAEDNGFVWKPESDNDHMLAIVTPAKHDFTAVNVFFGREQVKNEAGRYFGRANGNRQTWRFSKPGAKYGKDIKVIGIQRVGPDISWDIPVGAKRTEVRR